MNSSKVLIAERFVRQIQNLFGEISVTKMEVYWKDKSLYEIEFIMKINAKDVAELIYQTSIKASIISNNWNFVIPSNLEDNYLNFSGISDDITKIKEVKWVGFNLD